MNLKEALREYLLASRDLTALVGTRLYYQVRPREGARPYLVYWRTSSRPGENLEEGTDQEPTDYYTLACFGDCAEDTEGLAQVVRRLFRTVKYPATWLGFPVGNVAILEGGRDSYALGEGGTETGVYVTEIDIAVTYSEVG